MTQPIAPKPYAAPQQSALAPPSPTRTVTPATIATTPAAAIAPKGLPEVRLHTGVEGAFVVSGGGLSGPRLSVWDKVLDALIEAFTLGFRDTRTFDNKVDETYWRAAALAILASRNGEPLQGTALDRALEKLEATIDDAHPGEDFRSAQIVAVVRATIARVQSDLSPTQMRAFLATVGDPAFEGRGAVLDIIGDENILGKNYWPAMVPLLRSRAFVDAPPARRREMLEKLASDVDVWLGAHVGREIDAFAIASRRKPSEYRIGPRTEAGTFAFTNKGPLPAVKVEITVGGKTYPVLIPKAETKGFTASIEVVAEAIATLPPAMRAPIKEIQLSPDDWAIASTDTRGHMTVYTQKHWAMKSAAGTANFFGQLAPILALVMAHEVGHDFTLGKHGISEAEWNEAVAQDLTRSTSYGSTDQHEEMAEVFKFYTFSIGTKWEKTYRDRWPARFALFDRMMRAYAVDPPS